MKKAFCRHEQLFFLAILTTNPEALKSDLEERLSDVTVENDEFV